MRAVILAVALVWGLTACSGDAAPSEAVPTATPTSPAADGVAATSPAADGVIRWSAPTLVEEPDLPPAESHLPPLIDLTADAPDAAVEPLRVARAAFSIPGTERVLLVQGDERRLLDVSRLAMQREGKRRIDLVTDRMLSPTGRWLLFPQRDHLWAFEVSAGRWRRLEPENPQGRWLLTEVAWMRGDTFTSLRGIGGKTVGVSLPDLQPQLGPSLTWSGDDGAPFGVHIDGGELAQADGVPTPTGTSIHVAPLQSAWQELVIGSELDERPRGCCPMVSFTPDNEVYYESRAGTETRLLRWRVGTDDVGLVTRVTGVAPGTPYVASWASYELP